MKRWLLGQFIATLAIGAVTGIGLTLLGVPQAVSLALIAALLEFIPFIGPIVAAIPALLVAFIEGGMTPLYVALLYLAVQQVKVISADVDGAEVGGAAAADEALIRPLQRCASAAHTACVTSRVVALPPRSGVNTRARVTASIAAIRRDAAARSPR